MNSAAAINDGRNEQVDGNTVAPLVGMSSKADQIEAAHARLNAIQRACEQKEAERAEGSEGWCLVYFRKSRKAIKESKVIHSEEEDAERGRE